MARIHPTATVDPTAQLGDDVEIGPYCVVDPDVSIGAGCVLREGVVVRRYTTMGQGNFIDAHAVLGGLPQDLKFDPNTVSYVRIGDDNTFREGVTISRASLAGQATVVGDRSYWMACSHAGHDATVEGEAILCNGAIVGGHATIGKRAFLSANVSVHQFTWVGEGAMSRGHAGTSTHIPPFALFADINRIAGMNTVGMKRNEQMTSEDRRQVKEAFTLTYRSGLSPAAALAEMDKCTDWGPWAGKFRDFIRKVIAAEGPYRRALCPMRKRVRGEASI